MEAADFSGYATRAGLKCTDGRTIAPSAFQHMDGEQVPLVWQHGHNSPENILGHAVLQARDDGVYAYGFFNNTTQGQNAKALVQHKDINRMSIYANKLVERGQQVLHGMIREVSLVLSGANPGALIDYVAVQHDDGEIQQLDDEAIIYTGLELEHEDVPVEEDAELALTHAIAADATIADVYNSMTPEQQGVCHYLVGAALDEVGASVTQADEDGEGAAETTETTETEDETLTHKEGTTVSRNVFDQSDKAPAAERHVLSHADVQGIVSAAQKTGSLKQAVEDYALAHGINDIDLLFPEARSITDRPEWDKRRTEWVAGVLNGTRKSPFSRVKSMVADLTLEEARAKGYIKGNLKKEQFFGLTKRTTTPTTIYKKQKLDRDDIVDITDFDVVAWMKTEMRFMLEEELARAILIGDGRDVADEDKIKDPAGATDGAGIRSIANDDDLYAPTFYVNLADASSSYMELMEAMIRARKFYKGTGNPTLYTTESVITEFLLLRDAQERRYFRTVDDLAAELRVSSIVAVEPMEDEATVIAIMVNLDDYNIGADKGGEVSLFDDFDIDYNQFKYLIETRISGALVKIRSALVFRTVDSGDTLVAPTEPAFVANVITVPTITGVTYKRADTDATVTTGAPITLTSGQSLTIYAVPASGSYFFANNVEDEWTFTYEA
jgi:hypothetical protein